MKRDPGSALSGLEALLATLTPEVLTAYLRAKGWVVTHDVPDRYRIWQPTRSGSRAAFLVPASQAFADYRNRVAEGLCEVAGIEERHVLDALWEALPEEERPELVKAIFPRAREAIDG